MIEASPNLVKIEIKYALQKIDAKLREINRLSAELGLPAPTLESLNKSPLGLIKELDKVHEELLGYSKARTTGIQFSRKKLSSLRARLDKSLYSGLEVDFD